MKPFLKIYLMMNSIKILFKVALLCYSGLNGFNLVVHVYGECGWQFPVVEISL
jgi:hypothetical protein